MSEVIEGSVKVIIDACFKGGYEKGYQQGRADAIDEFREYLKTIEPCEMPKDIWDLGIDRTCDRMLKEQKDE